MTFCSIVAAGSGVLSSAGVAGAATAAGWIRLDSRSAVQGVAAASTLAEEIMRSRPQPGRERPLPMRNAVGDTPLHFCLAGGHAELAVYLIAKGADPNAANDAGAAPYERGRKY